MSGLMSSHDRLYTLVKCSDQLLAAKVQTNFNSKNKIIENFYSPLDFYLPT